MCVGGWGGLFSLKLVKSGDLSTQPSLLSSGKSLNKIYLLV